MIYDETAEQYAQKMCKLRTKKEVDKLIKWAEDEISEYKRFIKEVKKIQKCKIKK